ncbi:MAG: hypothetical protein Q8941_11565 [Bacteroidota bacterium]|nr:hypothetical protein [Bacteroidota bacterium]
MKKWVILLFASALIFSCKNGNDRDKKIESKEKKETTSDTSMKAKDGDKRDKESGYKWKEPEQNKFLEDCRINLAGKVDSAKMKDFCSCMLTQAQKYYPGYKQMDETSNPDYDSTIFVNCLEKYPGDKDDE